MSACRIVALLMCEHMFAHEEPSESFAFARGGGRRFALNARELSSRAPEVVAPRSSSTVRRGEASRRRGASVRLHVSRLRPAYAPAFGLAGRSEVAIYLLLIALDDLGIADLGGTWVPAGLA